MSRSRGHLTVSALLGFGLALASVSGASSNTRVGEVYSPRELIRMLKNAGWTPLPFPDSKFVPGAIIKVTPEGGVRWVDDLSSCRYRLSEFELKSYVPAVTFTKQIQYSASAVLNIHGISAGPGFDRASTVRMEIVDQGADAFRIVLLKVRLEDAAFRESVSPLCLQELLAPDTYLVTEAFRVSKGKYSLYDKKGTRLSVSTAGLLKIEPSLKHEVTADGSLLIEQPVYFAVRQAVRLADGGLKTLGEEGTAPKPADALIERIFLETAGRI